MSKIQSGQLIGKRESVTDEILLLNEHQTPFLSLLGFSTPVTQVEHVWFEDEMYGDESTTTADLTNVATTVSVADGSVFRAGHVIKIGEELLKVTAVANNDLTVTRGYAGTTAAASTSGAVVEVQFVEGVEGADARAARFKPRARKSNFTQIFDETISISGTAAVVSQYGLDDLYEYEKQKKQLELALQLEKALINGVKFESQDGLTRQMGGIRSTIVTNVINASNAALDADKINDAFQKIYEKGGFSNGGNFKIVVGAKQKRAISAFDAAKVNIDRLDNGRGQVVDHFVSDFGQAEIVLNNNLAADELFVVDANRMSIHPLTGRDFAHEYLGKKGDYYEGQIVGEYTTMLQQEKAHARIKGLA